MAPAAKKCKMDADDWKPAPHDYCIEEYCMSDDSPMSQDPQVCKQCQEKQQRSTGNVREGEHASLRLQHHPFMDASCSPLMNASWPPLMKASS